MSSVPVQKLRLTLCITSLTLNCILECSRNIDPASSLRIEQNKCVINYKCSRVCSLFCIYHLLKLICIFVPLDRITWVKLLINTTLFGIFVLEAVPAKEVELDGRRCQVNEDLQSKGKQAWERLSERNLGRNFKHLGMLPTKKLYEEFATSNWYEDTVPAQWVS